jgi:TrmH family RNA methyltransferase
LRKISRIFTEVEYQMSLGKPFSTSALSFLGELVELFRQDGSFSPVAVSALQTLGIGPGNEDGELRRALKYRPPHSHGQNRLTNCGLGFHRPRGRLDPKKRWSFPGIRIYLEDIRSFFNVGAMFRTSKSFGTEGISLFLLYGAKGSLNVSVAFGIVIQPSLGFRFGEYLSEL